jgi:hypothetical protein
MADENFKPVPMGPGERATAIPAPKNSLAAMLAKGMSDSDIRANAPESHRQMDRRMGIKSEEEARAMAAAGLDKPLPRGSAASPAKSAMATSSRWRRGDQARDTKHGVVVTILAARVKVNEEGIPYHRVAAGGETWVAKETRLKPVKG